MLPEDRRLDVKLNLARRLQAGKMPTVADVAGAGGVAGVPVPGQHRGGGYRQHSANREQCDGLPGYGHWRCFSELDFSIARKRSRAAAWASRLDPPPGGIRPPSQPPP